MGLIRGWQAVDKGLTKAPKWDTPMFIRCPKHRDTTTHCTALITILLPLVTIPLPLVMPRLLPKLPSDAQSGTNMVMIRVSKRLKTHALEVTAVVTFVAANLLRTSATE